MGRQSEFRFLCPGCRASFGWKPQYAGRKIRCKCGQVFLPPDPPAAQASEAEPDLYDVSGDAAAPAPTHQAVTAQVAAPTGAPPVNRLDGVAALYGHRARRVAQQEAADAEGTALKDLYIPLALLALGLGLRVAQLLVANANRANKWGGHVDAAGNPTRAVLFAACQLIIACAVMVAGATVAAMVLNLNLGTVGRAGLKLCAIAVFGAGVASWVAVFDQDRNSVTGLMIALHVVVIINWIGFAYLFALELQETLLAVAIISVLHAAATCALWTV
jgi:hypothetical protein